MNESNNKHLIAVGLVFLCIFFSDILAGNQNNKALKSKYPWAVILKDTIDMGVLRHGSTSRNHITIRNEGWHDLIIAGVRSSCGLMIPNWPTDTIRPNEEASINFRFNASRLGSFERKVTIHTNAYQKNIVITVLGEVVPTD